MRGAFMILSTPYTAANEVDYQDLAGEVDFCDRCGIEALVWPQNSSEQRYLSKAERLRGFDVLAEANHGRAPPSCSGCRPTTPPACSSTPATPRPSSPTR